MDENEFIAKEECVTHAKLLEIIGKGQMNVASSFAIMLGLNKLKNLNLI
jgi:hypothetical protein